MACKSCGKNRKQMPSVLKQAWNFSRAVAAFVVQPGFVDTKTYSARVAVCDSCDKRGGATGHRCTICGCIIATKAAGLAWDCPEGRWGSSSSGI